MTLALALTLFVLGTAGAFVAGLLGVGGAIVMIPLLLYVPSFLGVGTLTRPPKTRKRRRSMSLRSAK